MIFDARPILDRLYERFPELEAFRSPIAESQVDRNAAGRHIDLANAIFECVGKNAWKNNGKSPNPKNVEKAMAPEALIGAKGFFEKRDPSFCAETWDALIAPAGKILGRRSESGDISHGHLPEKPDISVPYAAMSLNLALSFAAYYFAILDTEPARLNYDDYRDSGGFNEWLNQQGEPIGAASYSWLLYLHDYDAYEAKHDDYVANFGHYEAG